MQEVFKTIKGFPDYQVSNHGRVVSNKYGKVRELALRCSGPGYAQVIFSHNGKPKAFTVHQLVMEYFYPKKRKGKCVNHIDGNKLNNRIDNLESCTQLHNVTEAIRIGLRRPMGEYTKQPRRIIITDESDVEYNVDSLRMAAKFLGVTTQAIYNGCTGRQKTVKGVRVKYAD